jgi:CheY-like chemotaxis protein
MLPKVDGLKILKEIKKKPELSKIPVILLTNLGADAVIKEAFTLGATAYIIKSEYTPDQVINEVNKVFTQETAA